MLHRRNHRLAHPQLVQLDDLLDLDATLHTLAVEMLDDEVVRHAIASQMQHIGCGDSYGGWNDIPIAIGVGVGLLPVVSLPCCLLVLLMADDPTGDRADGTTDERPFG